MKKVLYTGAFRFPEGDAASARVYSVAKLFELSGFSVVFAGWESAKENNIAYHYKGHSCFPQSEFREKNVNLISRLLGFLLRGKNTAKWLLKNKDFDVIVVYNPPAIFSLYILLLGKFRSIPVLLDSTEWYESQHLPGGRRGIAALENWIRMRLVYRLFTNVICISDFLKTYYGKRNVIKILPLASVPIEKIESRGLIKKKIAFLYAGDAGKKDKLIEFIKVLPQLSTITKEGIVFNIAGMDVFSLETLLKSEGLCFNEYKEFIVCHGRISRQNVMDLYKQVHFSVFFREKKRYALAGFPTKAMESLTNGCPIITNRVGDLCNMLSEMKDSIFVEETQLQKELPILMKEIIDRNMYAQMQINAIKKAEFYFSLSSYEIEFQRFIRNLSK